MATSFLLCIGNFVLAFFNMYIGNTGVMFMHFVIGMSSAALFVQYLELKEKK